MIIDKDVPIVVNDGHVLRANVYRPAAQGRYPILMAMGIYGKDVHFEDGYRPQWDKLLTLNPKIASDGSSGRYLRWELIDPERWVPEGYVVIAVDSRGSGKSPGYLDPLSPRETQDFHDAIEWAAVQDWSSGKVGLIGISYYAIKQWQVASLRPPHLAAICPWEGGSDIYRDWSHHGGILSNAFLEAWMPRQVLPNQNGNATTQHRDRETGLITTGEPVKPGLLLSNRADHVRDLLDHSLDDAWFRTRSPNLERIEVPVYSAGNWGGAGLHLRGNVEGYLRVGSKQKWLEMHVGTHFESFYLPRYIERQKKFFAHFLKGEDNGWLNEPRIRLEIRGPADVTVRDEKEWPLARTQWQRFHLHPLDRSLTLMEPDSETRVEYEASRDGIDFITAPFPATAEFTGPLATHLWVASTTIDLDIFASLRMFAPDGTEVVFDGASDIAPVARGWLRASHRKLDPTMSTPYRPYHAHDEIEKLIPGEIYPLEVELWPTSIIVPQGYRLMLTLRGCDMEFGGVPGRILHNHPDDRPSEEFAGTVTIVSGPGRESYLLLPLIPGNEGAATQ